MSEESYRVPRLARFTLIFLVVYLVGLSVTSFSPANILGILHDIGIIGLTVCLAIYLIRGVRWLKNRLLWKVRNKIIISFAFVGIFPLVLLLAISGLTLSLVLKRMGGIYLANELELIFESMEDTCSSAVLSYSRHTDVEADPLKTVLSDAQTAIAELPAGFDNSFFELYWLSPPDPNYRLAAIISRDGESNLETEASIGPDWLRDGFTGFVFRGEETNLVTCRDLSQEFRLVLHTPLDQKVLDYLTRRTSIALEVTRLSPNENPSEFRNIHSSFSARQDFFSFLWPHFFAAVVWEDGARASGTILLSVPTGILLDYYFFSQAEPLIPIIIALLIIFLLVELGSIVIGIVIARSITSSIHSIYTGVESIQKGEFHFRINSSNKDQLDAMANSFNDMSSSIVSLMNQVSEREWMEKELEIAKEVQNQLFPQQFPETRYLEISASCTPARQVSGDYYDFLPNGGNRLDIVIGDISGKGISAALMMASLVSIIRSGLNLPQERIQTERIARVVRESNRQFYKRSSPESFSTLVLNHFNADTKTLTYCNAGHHPPLVFSNGDLRELTAGGTVVGLFENWEFIASEIELKSGDLVVYFTDGVVEATNHEGEQFGSERLIQLVGENTFLTAEDVQAMIVEQVFVWADGEEQADDITVLCMKVLE